MKAPTLVICLSLSLLACQSSLLGKKLLDREVTAAQYGEKWPFTVSSGILRCLNPKGKNDRQVVFESGGKTYALNYAAGVAGKYVDVDPIRRDDPAPYIPKVDIGPMVSEGLSLCGS